jgi:hypothetical protein
MLRFGQMARRSCPLSARMSVRRAGGHAQSIAGARRPPSCGSPDGFVNASAGMPVATHFGMNLTASTGRHPCFFGRVPELLNEQQHFAATLESLRSLCEALDAGRWPDRARLDPVKLLDELERALARHVEEADECLMAIALTRRDLLPAVVDIRSDHVALSQGLLDVRIVAGDELRWGELSGAITALLGKLAEHRDAEAALFHQASQNGSRTD